MADKLKFALALLLLAAGVAGFYLLREQALVVRVLSVLLGVAAGAAVLGSLNRAAFRSVCSGGGPRGEESRLADAQGNPTLIVFGFVVVMALVLFLTDKTLEWVLYDLVLGWKKS
jgi:preprotein translocase subunit SecE